MSRIVVTGIGVITALGDSAAANRAALKDGQCGISFLELFPSRYSETLRFGEVKISNEQLKQKFDITDKGVTRTSLLAIHAFEEAIEDSGLTKEQLASYDTALIGANTVGGMCLTDELYHDANNDTEGSEYISSYDIGSVNLYMQKRYNIKGIGNTINTACSSSANAIMYGARLIQHGLAQRAIVGGADSLAKFTINGFNSLHILSPEICRPFDIDRQGLNLGEGAAFLVLEKEEEVISKKPYVVLSGYCNASDAFHPSSLSDEGDGPYLAMQGAVQFAGLNTSDIDFVNAHGTGTVNNDEVESKAMSRLFETVPAFSSTKSNTGHTLGASGAVEAVYSILSLKHQELYPSLQFETAIESTGLKPLQEYIQQPVQHVMSNSFGFGGNCSSLIFSRA
ncbi:MAG: fabF [Chitinophagaceae bacterium]|nr:fabF [Chitinophagaceae bacterium]